MSGTQKQRAATRPAMPWFSLCAALVAVGVLVLLPERSRGDGAPCSRNQGSYAPALRQALFGREVAGPAGAGSDRAGMHGADLDGAAMGLVSDASGASGAASAEGAAGGGSDSAADPVLASEAALSVPSESLGGDESQAVPATTPVTTPVTTPASVPAARPVH